MESPVTRRSVPVTATVVFVIFAAVVILIGYLYYRDESAQYRVQVGRELDAYSSLKIAQINRWRNERLADAASLTQNTDLTISFDRLRKGGTNERLRVQLSALLEPIWNHHDYAGIFFVDPSGIVRFQLGDSLFVSTTCTHGVSEGSNRHANAFVPSLHRTAGEDRIHVDIIAPMFKGQGGQAAFLGNLVLQVDPYLDLYPLVQSWPAPERTSECILVENVQNEILLLNEPELNREGAHALAVHAQAERLLEERAVHGEEGIVSGLDYRHNEVLASIRKVPGSNWYLLTKAPVGIMNVPLKIRAWLAVVLTLVLLGTAGAALIFLWRRKLLEIESTGAGPQPAAVPFMYQYDALTRYSNDIILLMTTDGTIVNANDRAVDTYGYSRDELAGMNIRTLRAPETLSILKRQMELVAERGGMRYETIHRRKDGHLFPVETSSRVIEVEGKKFLQSIIRDIAERKKGEERLTKLNSCFLGLGLDPVRNINALVGLCGELLGATSALYNRLDGDLLCSVGQWGTPKDFQAKDRPEGHLCYDVIRGNGDKLVVVRNLHKTKYAKTDPNVLKYDLKTYVGKGVRFGEENVGSLCALFQKDFVPSAEDEKLMGIISAAIGVEENRRHEKDALRESEDRYRQLIEFSPDAIAVHKEGRFIFVNRAGIRLIGAKEPKDLIGKPILDIVHPDYRELARARAFQQPGECTEQPFVEEKFVRFDGSVVDVEVAATPIMYDGEPATLVVARDLEDRKRAQEELVRLREAAESSGEIIFMTDAQGVITFVNPEFTMIYGYTPEDVVGKVTPRILKSGIQEPWEYDVFWKALLKKEVVKGELVNKRKDGRLITVEGSASPIVGDKGAILGYLAVQRNITERKRVDKALRGSEASYRGLFNSVSDAIYIQDREGKFLDVNQGAIEMYGYPKEFFIGKTPADLSAPGLNDLEATMEAVRKTFAGEPQRFEWWGKRKNGEIFPKEVRLNRSLYFGQEVVVALAQDITERKRAEEAMRKSDLRFRRVWENSLDGMRILDLHGNFVMVNDAFCRLVGKKYDELIGKPYGCAYKSQSAEQDAEDIKTLQHRIANRTFARNQEVELSLQDGRRVLVELSNSLLEIPNEPPLLLSMFRDITERRDAEAKLRESEEKFRTLSEQSPNMIYINKGGRIVYANQRCVELMGYSKEEFNAPTFNYLSLIAPEHISTVKKNFSKHLAGEELPPYEYALIAKNRRRVVGLHTTRLIDFEGESAILGIVTDVTGTRHAEEELRKLQRAVEQSPSSIVITDTEGAIEYVNPKFCEITGYSLAEAIGENPRILKTGHTTPEQYAALWETIRSGQEWRGEFRNKKKNGEIFWEQASISPVRDAVGNITHFLAVKEDITKRKILEQQLWQAQKMEGIGTLASGIAHDFNNILGIILGYASLLLQKSVDREKINKYVNAIVKATDRGAGLVRQILTFARKSEFKLEKVDVNSLIGELAKMLGETFPKTISLSLQLEKSLPLLSVDRTQLHQALLNLCVNARDAMADKGALSVTTRLVSGNTLGSRFAAAYGRKFVEISVSDTGVGIDETTKHRVFEPFFTTKEVGKGTGLGLAVVFGVVQEHQGFVDVESELGRGSTFRVYLPVPEGIVPDADDVGAGGADIPGGSETILVVEDEDLMLEFVVTLLEQRGYHTLKATDGEEAIRLHKVHRGEIDLVLSDIGLPKLDGWEACQQMKRNDPELVVFLASGYLEPALKAEIQNAGVSGFIEKPYRPHEILQQVREALDSR